MKCALVQTNPTLNDFEGNLGQILRALAATRDADLIVFPELTLSGYYPQDLVEDPEFLSKQDYALVQVMAATQGNPATVVIGLVSPNKGAGKPFHNSLLAIRDGAVVLNYRKQLLPTYNVFDERRHFEPGPNVPAILDLCGHRVGFLICEDGWNPDGKDYVSNPLQTLKQAGAELVVSINASPSNIGKREDRHALFEKVSSMYGYPVLYVNQVGGNDSLVYDGASFVVAPSKGVIWEMPSFINTAGTVQVNFETGEITADSVFQRPKGYACDSAFYWDQIHRGVLDYFRKTGFEKAVLGCSGGIDSALVLAIAVEALGAENVTAITMPSRFSSHGSVSDSEALCKNLGVQLLQHPIQPIVDRYAEGFETCVQEPLKRLSLENLQARVRGTILMEYSNQTGALLLTTGNKSEVSCGYFTLYGDSNGGLNPIGDLYKTEVFALARWLNEQTGTEIIPKAIIEKPPSAELSPGQKDTDSLPPYETLDAILKLLVEGPRLRPSEHLEAEQLVSKLNEADGGETLNKVKRLLATSEFKRRQAPPIIRVRGRAFGSGRQVPVAAKY
jgi:NAD+ synthetase